MIVDEGVFPSSPTEEIQQALDEILPTPPLSFDVAGFEVDSASACKYTLDFAPVLTLSNAGADGETADARACGAARATWTPT